MSDLPLSGRTALVTGSARRIGREIATRLAEMGASVMVHALSSRDDAETTATALRALGVNSGVSLADVGDPGDAVRLVNETVAYLGGLDILVNSAAIRPASDFETLTYAEWRRVTATILDGAFLVSQAAAPHLRMRDSGRIVNIGGITAHIGAMHRPHVVAAKAGLVGLTRALALELGPDGVTVNCVAPGLIEDPNDDPDHIEFRRRTTPPEKIPLRRIGVPGDIAAVVAQLCTDDFAYTTGQVIHVNGGLYGC